MDDENVFRTLQNLMNEFNGNFNIINEKISIQLQSEYFKFSEEIKKNINTEEVLSKRDLLLMNELSIDEKKSLLSQLASIDDVSAYRTIEKYLQKPDEALRLWALLAFQESKMLLQSKLLDENQLFISTGLGGVGNKLRYFIVIISKNEIPFNEFQQKIIIDEFNYTFQKSNSEVEEIKFTDTFAAITSLVPINVALSELFSKAVNECNQYGNFIKDNGIITNVKILSVKEIKDFLETKNLPDNLGSKNE